MNILKKFMLEVIKHKVSKLFRLERSLSEKDNALKSDKGSPEKIGRILTEFPAERKFLSV